MNIGATYGVAVSGSYVYTQGTSGLHVFEVSNPASPTAVASIGTPGGSAVTVSGSYAYAGGGVHVLDVSNPSAPVIVGSLDTPGASAVAVSGSYVYVTHDSGLTILMMQCQAPTDVRLSSFRASSQPGAILLEWATSLESDFSGFHVQRSTASDVGYRQLGSQLIAPPTPYRFLDFDVIPGETYNYRLEVLDRSGEREFFGSISARADPIVGTTPSPRLAQSHPNPFVGGTVTIPFTTARSGEVGLRILDLSGRQTRLLIREHLLPGEHEVSWNGRNDAGKEVPAGLYLYELTAPGLRATRRMIRIR